MELKRLEIQCEMSLKNGPTMYFTAQKINFLRILIINRNIRYLDKTRKTMIYYWKKIMLKTLAIFFLHHHFTKFHYINSFLVVYQPCNYYMLNLFRDMGLFFVIDLVTVKINKTNDLKIRFIFVSFYFPFFWINVCSSLYFLLLFDLFYIEMNCHKKTLVIISTEDVFVVN